MVNYNFFWFPITLHCTLHMDMMMLYIFPMMVYLVFLWLSSWGECSSQQLQWTFFSSSACSCWPSSALLLVHACRIRWLASFRSIHRQAESHWPLWKVHAKCWCWCGWCCCCSNFIICLSTSWSTMHMCWISRKIHTSALIFNSHPFSIKKKKIWQEKDTCSVLMFIYPIGSDKPWATEMVGLIRRLHINLSCK